MTQVKGNCGKMQIKKPTRQKHSGSWKETTTAKLANKTNRQNKTKQHKQIKKKKKLNVEMDRKDDTRIQFTGLTEDSQSGPERKSLTQEYLETNYPKESWTHGYTDVSAENAARNGGKGVYIQYAQGKEDKISLATGLYSTNYKAEAEAMKTAAAHIEVSTHASPNVVLTDALSVLQALQSNRDTELNDLSAALASLCRGHAVTLQWIPTHCNVPGNEAADSLAKGRHNKEASG